VEYYEGILMIVNGDNSGTKMRDSEFTLTFVFALIALTIKDFLFLCFETFREKVFPFLQSSLCNALD